MEVMRYAKAVVPVAVGAVIYVLAQFGVTAEMTVKEAVTLAVTAGLVYLVRNRK